MRYFAMLFRGSFCWGAPFVVLAACQAQSPTTPARVSGEQWRQDLAYLTAQLEQRHPRLYAHLTPATWHQAIERLQQQADAQSADQMRLGVQQLVALVRDGHTRLAHRANPPTYPVSFRWFPDGIYATLTHEPGRAASGLKLVRLNRISVEEALCQLGSLVSADNEVGRRTGAVRLLSNAEVLAFCHLARPDSVVYELVDSLGQARRLTVAAQPDSVWQATSAERPVRPGAPRPLYLQRGEEPFWFATLPAQRAVYVQYNTCQDMAGFLRFSWRLTRLLEQQKPTRLLLDLRFNKGGNSRQFAPLRWYLVHSALNQRGHLFVLIGRNTFSSGLRAACELKQQTQALLVGEATGGCPTTHFTEVKQFRLPHSGLEIQYASRQTTYLPELGAAMSLLPDIAAPLTITAYRQGEDPALEAALAFPAP